MTHGSPDVLVVCPPDTDGVIAVRAGSPDGPLLARVAAAGPPGAAGRAPAGGLVIGAPAPAPAGSRRALIGPDGCWHGYLEYRWNLSLVRCITALVVPDEGGVLAWTRERAVLPALASRLRDGNTQGRARRVPPTALMMGQQEAASVNPVGGGYALRWGDGPRLGLRHAAVIAVALALPR